jgi:hypothetical protein
MRYGRILTTEYREKGLQRVEGEDERGQRVKGAKKERPSGRGGLV